MYWHYNINVLTIIYFSVVDLNNTIGKWDIITLLLSSACLAAASSPAIAIVLFPLTWICATL